MLCLEPLNFYEEGNIMPFTKEFLKGRHDHLVAKKNVTKAAQAEREELHPAEYVYKERVLVQIEAAFKRLANKTYGFCPDCSNEIPEERLVLFPQAERCVQCQKEREELRLT